MMDDFEENQNEYEIDDELSRILNPEKNETEYSSRMNRSIKTSRYQRVVQKKSVMLKRLRGLLRFLITLILIYLTYVLMTVDYWYLPKDTITSYKIKRIEIVGNRITPTYKIVNSISSIELPHKPIYMIDTDEFVKKISTLASVRKVYVKRLWAPARIIIYIEEREPVLTIAPSKDVLPIAYFSIDGTLVGRDYLPLPEGYNPFLVLSYGNKNDDYTKWNKDRVLFIDKLVRTIEKASGEKVEYVDMRKPDDVFIKLTSTNIRVGELDTNTYNRIKDIKSILAKTRSFEKKIKYIDLSWEESKFIKLGSEEETKKEDTQKEDNKKEEKNDTNSAENSDSTNQ